MSDVLARSASSRLSKLQIAVTGVSIFRTASADMQTLGKRLLLPSVALVFALLGVEVLRAATYYVSPSGSDFNSGSSSRPWKTIGRVNYGNYNAGDVILFQGGKTFSGGITLTGYNAHGTPANPVAVGSYGTGKATIRSTSTAGLSILNAAGIRVENLNFVSASTSNNNSGIFVFNALAGNVKLDTIILNNLDVSGFGQHGMVIAGWNGTSGFTNVQVTNNSVHDNLIDGMITVGYSGHVHTNLYIARNHFYNNPGIASMSVSSGSGLRVANVDGAVIERNVAYNNGAENTSVPGPAGIWAVDSNNVTIQYNEAHHMRTKGGDGVGFDLDGGVTNSVMQFNYSHDNDGAGFLLSSYFGAAPHSNNILRYNISQNDSRLLAHCAICFWDGGGGISSDKVYNNTVYMAPNGRNITFGLIIATPVQNVTIANNIFYAAPGVAMLYVAPGQTGVEFRSNNYYVSDGSLPWTHFADATSIGDLMVNPQLVGPGTGGTINNGDLVSTSLSGYALAAGSPMIDAGWNIYAVLGTPPSSSDYSGIPIPQLSAYDIGAMEVR